MAVFLRNANIEDAQILLEWKNDPITIDSAFINKFVDYKTHIQWFENKLLDRNCFMYILMDGIECVGQLRIDKVGDIGEIDYTIAPNKRKMGYGSIIIKLAEEIALNNIKVLMGLVKDTNKPSKKCFKNNKFTEFAGGGDCLLY